MRKGFALVGLVATMSIVSFVALQSWQILALGYGVYQKQNQVLKEWHDDCLAAWYCNQIIHRCKNELKRDVFGADKPLELHMKHPEATVLCCERIKGQEKSDIEEFLCGIWRKNNLILRKVVR